MEAKPNRSYEDFDPVCKWRRDEGRDTFEVHLPGFRREQIRVQVNHLGFIVISGERPLDGTRWKRFNKEVELPKFCNVDAIHANFMHSILSVVMPKKIPTSPKKEQEIRQISEYEHHEIEEEEEEEETGHRYLEFQGWSIREEGKHRRHEALGHDIDAADDDHHHHYHEALGKEGKHGRHEALGDDIDAADDDDHHHEFAEHNSGLSPETTRDVAFKLMIVVIVILVIGSYVTDMCKSIMADSFHN